MASIDIIAAGQPIDIVAPTVVTVDGFPLGATTYQWEFLYKPEGSVAAFAAPTAQSTTFNLDVTGSYLIRLVVDGTDIAQVIAASPEASPNFGAVRFPAGGETFEVDGTFGWAHAVEKALRVAVKAEQLAASNDRFLWKDASRLAADSDQVLLAAAPLGNIDSIAPVFGDRVLLFGQAPPTENGIYVYTDIGAGNYQLIRATDFDEPLEVAGAASVVEEGTLYADRIFIQTEAVAAVGVDPLNFVSIGATTTFSALTDTDVITQAPTNGDSVEYQAGTLQTKKHNLAAAVAPVGGDNFAAGYSVGSVWVDTTADKAYICVGDGIWIETTATGITIQTDGIVTFVDAGMGAKKSIRWTMDDGGGSADYEVELTAA